MMLRSSLSTALGLVLFVGFAADARSELITPVGLNPGDTFRYVFVTSTGRDAVSRDMADYDSFVTQAASAAGLTTYGGSAVSWQALASADEDHIDAVTRVSAGSAPLYLITGEKVADTGNDLWDKTLDHPINMTELGTTYNGEVWTGTFWNGVGLWRLGDTFGAGGSLVGRSDVVDLGWTWNLVNYSQEDSLPLYAVSSELTAQAVPEPGTLTMFVGLGICGILGTRLSRRQKAMSRPGDSRT